MNLDNTSWILGDTFGNFDSVEENDLTTSDVDHLFGYSIGQLDSADYEKLISVYEVIEAIQKNLEDSFIYNEWVFSHDTDTNVLHFDSFSRCLSANEFQAFIVAIYTYYEVYPAIDSYEDSINFTVQL